MRILHVVHQYAPEHVGGTELYTQTLADYQVREGHSVSVFTPTASSPDDSALEADLEDGVRVFRFPAGKRSRRSVFLDTFAQNLLLRAFEALLDRENPEVVHVQHLMGLPMSLVRGLAARQLPYVVTLHDYWYVCANAQLVTNYNHTVCGGPDRWFFNCGRCAIARAGYGRPELLSPAVAPLMAYRNHRLRRLLENAHRVIAPTHFVQHIYREAGLSLPNMIVLPHGIDVPQQKIDRLRLERRPRHPHTMHIGYVGSLGRPKGVHNLIAAVNRLPREGVKLSIYGGLTTFPEYVAELKLLADHPGIRFAGWVSRDDLWAALIDFDVVVLPTLWYEASPLTIQEVFAVGVPLVASRIGAMQEKIHDGVDGILVPPDDVDALHDALLKLFSEPELLEKLRSGIRPVYTLAQQVKDIDAIYRQQS